jgi:hypothetical protein
LWRPATDKRNAVRYVRHPMRINPAQVFADKAKRDAEVKPLPKVVFNSKVESKKLKVDGLAKADPLSTLNFELSTPTALNFELSTHQLSTPQEKPELKELWSEMTRVKKQRNMLSTRTVRLVAELEAKLMEQSPAMAAEFMKGNLPMAELVEHYASIQSQTNQAKAIYYKISFFEQYGKLPEPKPTPSQLDTVESDKDANSIKYEIRRLDDVIYKTKKKIVLSQNGIKGPRNSDRVLEWKTKISLAVISRTDLKIKLKHMRDDNINRS